MRALFVLMLAGAVCYVAVTRLFQEPEPTDEADLDHTSLSPVPVAGRILYQSEVLGLPGPLAILGDTLLVLDLLGDPVIHALDRRTGKAVAVLGTSGEGPGQFIAPVALDPATDGTPAVWVHDVRLQRLTRMRFAPDTIGPDPLTLPFRADGPAIDVIGAGRDRFLAHGFFHGGRLAVLDASTGNVRYSGPLPDNPTGVPRTVLQHAYQGSLAARPDRMRFALATRHAGWIEIFNAAGERLRRFSGPFAFEPVFGVDRSGPHPVMTTSSKLRFGYIDVAAGQHRLYALFSGRTRSGFPERANYGEYVHVFDWEGQLERVFHLDADAFTVAVDSGETALWVTRHEPVPAVLRYELPGALAWR